MLTWKYEIGEVLVHAASLVEPVPLDVARLFVVERLAQQCPGGTQLSYRCRAVGQPNDGQTLHHDYVIFNEVELVRHADWLALAAVRTARELSSLCDTLKAKKPREIEPGT